MDRSELSLPISSPLNPLQDVCENATVALFVMDARQRCAYMNRSAEQMTGFTLAEVQGQPLHDFVHHHHPDGRPYPIADCPIDRAAPQNNQARGEEVFVHKDGHFYPVAFTASPVRRDGRVVGTVIEVRDISAQRQQEAVRDALQRIGLLILQELDLGRMVQAVTDAATALTGAQFGAFFYNVLDGAGESLMLYTLSGAPREAFDHFPLPRATALFGPTYHGEGTIRIADVLVDPRYGRSPPYHGLPPGHPPVRSYLAVPVKLGDGRVVGGLFFGHAAPGVFSAEHERIVESLAGQAAFGLHKAQLREAAERARQRAEHEAADNERLYRQAAEANRLKDQFLATVSHELRTPLTSILGWTKMLTGGRLAPGMVERAIQTIERNARAQAQIVEDLLDISRIVSGKLRLDLQLFDPASSTEAAVDAVRPAAIAKEIDLQLQIDPQAAPLSGDPQRLQQIVWNLVANAVKFTPRGGAVQVHVQRVDGQIEIAVHDTGAGIEPEFLPHIFERFSQADASSTRQHGGLGLGLAIVRQLVEMHGGSVSADSEGLGRGATFRILLPLAAPQAEAAPAPSPRESPAAVAAPAVGALAPSPDELRRFGLGGCRVLLLDDDDDTRELLATVLGAGGAAVEACSTADQALALAAALPPEVVVSDIGMPGKDGYAFIRALREAERAASRPSVPAIALTAYARVEDRLRAMSEGFQMHVAKPVEPAELLAVVASLRGWRADR